MKKTLLAAALLAGFAGAAHAQSSVTLYGIVDVGIGGNKVKGEDSAFGMVSGVQSGSRWGVRGSEDLGNGLRANFQLESGFDVGNGKSLQRDTENDRDRLFGRQAWGGLSGNWGEVRLGRQVTVAADYFAFTDPFGTGFQQAAAGSTFSSNNTNRVDNTLAYFSPKFSGFQAGVGYSFNQNGGVAASDDQANLISVGLKYANGPLGLALTYDQARLGDDTLWNAATGDENPYNVQLGGTWDFNVVKAYAAASYTKHGYTTDSLNTFGGENIKSYLVGLSAPIGNGSLFGSWQMADFSAEPPAGGDDKRNIYSVGYTYNMSKRTNLYAYYSYADAAFFDEDWTRSSYAVGIRHRF